MVQDIFFPNSVDEALDFLCSHNEKARIIAGGTDIILELQAGKKACDYLVDISRIPHLNEITEENGFIRIGANVTHTQVATSALIQKHAPGLAAASRAVGSLQIRNYATVMGNIMSANPAADAATALSPLGAFVEIVDKDGTKRVPLAETYAGICKSSVNSCCQMATHVYFPVKVAGEGSAYSRMDQRKALALPMLCAAVKVRLEGNTFENVCITAAPLGAGPQHLTEAEAFLTGAEVTPENIAEAARLAKAQASFRSSPIRGSKEYRSGVLPVFVSRALLAAVDHARSN